MREVIINPVHEVADEDWKPSNVRCNYSGCQGDCREAPPEQKPKAVLKLVNCLNREHCNGDYGFYVPATLGGKISGS